MKGCHHRIAFVISLVSYIALGVGEESGYSQTTPTTSATAGHDVTERSWNVAATPSLLTEPPSFRAIETFIRKEAGSEARLCAFRFDDLTSSGTYTLVASVDYSGRRFCNSLLLVTRHDGRFDIQELPSWNAEDLGRIIASLTGDGRKQIVVSEPLSDYEGAAGCVATWLVPYSWDGNQLVKSIRSFQDFYERRLQKIGESLERLERSGSASNSELPCLQMERDKILRALEMDPKAGFDRSQVWMRSEDPSLRRKAIRVFADRADQESIALLRVMESDADPVVAESARAAVISLARGRRE